MILPIRVLFQVSRYLQFVSVAVSNTQIEEMIQTVKEHYGEWGWFGKARGNTDLF